MVFLLADIKLATQNRLDAPLLRRLKEVDGPINIAMVGNRDRLLPDVGYMVDQLFDIERRSRLRRRGGTGHEAPANLHELRSGSDSFQPDAGFVLDNLEFGTRRELGTLTDASRNDHATCLIDGSSHTIILPSHWSIESG